MLEATPNHPLRTLAGPKTAAQVAVGYQLLCLSPATLALEPHTVLLAHEYAGGTQPVYNLTTEAGDSFLLNGVLVIQKWLSRRSSAVMLSLSKHLYRAASDLFNHAVEMLRQAQHDVSFVFSSFLSSAQELLAAGPLAILRRRPGSYLP